MWKKWWVWVLVGFGGLVVLSIIGNALGDPEESSTSVPTRARVGSASRPHPPPRSPPRHSLPRRPNPRPALIRARTASALT